MIQKFSLIIILIISTFTKAQSKIDSALVNLENNYAQEKVYLSLDRENYLNGETIYLKAYVFEGYKPSKISSTLFVEFYNKGKKILDKKTVMLTNGEGNGSIKLGEKLTEDVYYIRAYTPWMANFSEDFQSIQPVLVYNPESENGLEQNKNKEWTAELFPESGTFINSIATKFAVRRKNANDSDVIWSGYVIDKNNPSKKLVEYKNLDENVATFTLTPEFGVNYQTILSDAKGNTKTVDLPAVSERGVSFEVVSKGENINYKIKSINLLKHLKNYRIVGTINNHLAYSVTFKNDIEEYSGTIPTTLNAGENGVLQLSVFNVEDEIVAQRICFIKPNNLNFKQPIISSSPLDKTPRSENKFEVQNAEEFSNFFIKIVSANSKDLHQNNLLSTLYLTADFNSTLNNPAQYFSGKNNSEALDAVMISEQWQRFNWKDLLAGITPVINYKPQLYLSYKGKLALNSAALKNASVNLLIQNGDNQSEFFPTNTDDNGYLYINNVNIEQPTKITYFLNSTDKQKQSIPENLSLTFQPEINFVPLRKDLPGHNYQLITRTKNDIQRNVLRAIENKNNRLKLEKDETLIQEVVIRKSLLTRTAELNKELSNGLLRTMNARVFDFINEDQNVIGGSTVFQFLQGRVGGLTIQRDNYGDEVPIIRGAKAQIYLDDFPVDPYALNNISINDIAMVKVIKNGMVGNAIAVYMKKFGMKSINEPKIRTRDNSVIIKGYDKAEEYPVPNFKIQSYQNLNDLREVLYWNPSLYKFYGKPLEINFRNSDSIQKFNIVIISFNAEGKLLYLNESF